MAESKRIGSIYVIIDTETGREQIGMWMEDLMM